MKSEAFYKMQMERAGYKNLTQQDLELWAIVGEKTFYNIIDYAFRDAYWFCKFTEIMPGDEDFSDTFKVHRTRTINDALGMAYGGHVEYIPLIVKTDAEIVRDLNAPEDDAVLLLEEKCK
jgi:hypothetical protein